MQGIRDNLSEQNTAPLHKAISKVQEQHQSEQPNFSESLTLALYKFRVSCAQCENYGNLLISFFGKMVLFFRSLFQVRINFSFFHTVQCLCIQPVRINENLKKRGFSP